MEPMTGPSAACVYVSERSSGGQSLVELFLRRGSCRVTGNSMIKEHGVFCILSRIRQLQGLVSKPTSGCQLGLQRPCWCRYCGIKHSLHMRGAEQPYF